MRFRLAGSHIRPDRSDRDIALGHDIRRVHAFGISPFPVALAVDLINDDVRNHYPRAFAVNRSPWDLVHPDIVKEVVRVQDQRPTGMIPKAVSLETQFIGAAHEES